MLEALQDSWIAHAIGESQMLTASLSALHLLGFTLVMGSAVLANLRLMGLVLADLPFSDVMRPASRGLAVGLVVSATTGFLLFMPRAEGAAGNSTFRLKLSLLVAALLAHLFVADRVAAPSSAAAAARAVGATGLLLWFGVALAGCAFILLE